MSRDADPHLIGWAWSEEDITDPDYIHAREHRRFSDLAWEIAIALPPNGLEPRKVDEQHPELHGRDLALCWWACEWPERPYDVGITAAAACCRPCTIALGAAAVNRPHLQVAGYHSVPGITARRPGMVPIRVAYEATRSRFEFPPLPPLAELGIAPW